MLALPISVNPIDTIHHADCFVLMDWLYRAGIQVDLIASDMPYGTTACAWDKRVDLDQWWAGVKRVLKPRGVFLTTASEPFASLLRVSNLDWYKYDWVWDKHFAGNINLTDTQPMKTHEVILVFGKSSINYYPILKERITPIKAGGFTNSKSIPIQGRALHKTYTTKNPITILDFPRALGNSIHPTQKPVALYEYLIRTYTQPGDLVLDPFCGSGTTGLAALRTGRRYILGDSDLGYVEAARRRIQNADPFQPSQVMNDTMQLSLFAQVV